jgi:serine/threonine-protein kinase
MAPAEPLAPEDRTITTTGLDQELAMLPVKESERRFGRYELGYEIASGGMATIYLARARGPGGFDRPFAIKRIHPHLAKQRDFVDMFLDEARLQSRISHPNVCSVVDFGEVDGTYYMAMEYLLGRPLTAVMRAVVERPELHRSMRWQALAARMIADAAEGLHAAHELTDEHGRPLHLVHRDVTPHNLILTYEGAVKVIDFGVAFAEGRAHETRTGAVKGKFAYMSPEQVRGREIDRRVDVWALGVCLWELLTGKRLYGKRSDVELIHAVVNEPFAPPSSVVPVVPALDAIVMRALERDIDERTPTARALARELGTFVAATGIPAGTADLAELMQELDAVERTKRFDVVASLMSSELALEAEPTQAPRSRAATATVAPPVGAPTSAAAPAASTPRPAIALGAGLPERSPLAPEATVSLAGPVSPVPQPPALVDATPLGPSSLAVAPSSGPPSVTEPFPAVPAAEPKRAPAALVALAIVAVGGLGAGYVLWTSASQEPETVTVTTLPPLAPIAPSQLPPLVPVTPTPAIEPAIAPPSLAPLLAPSTPTPPPDGAPEPAHETARDEERRGGQGTLNVAVTGGWAEIHVDGVPMGTTPRRLTLPARRHVIELRQGDRVLARRTVTVRRGATSRVVVPLE